MSPGWCGSVDWAPSCEPKGCWFNSRSGHMPGLLARSLAGGAWEATDQWISQTLMFLSSPPLKINKENKEKEIAWDMVIIKMRVSFRVKFKVRHGQNENFKVISRPGSVSSRMTFMIMKVRGWPSSSSSMFKDTLGAKSWVFRVFLAEDQSKMNVNSAIYIPLNSKHLLRV